MSAVAVEDLRRLQASGVALSEDGLARLAESDRESEAAEDARAARASEAAETLTAAQSVYLTAREAVFVTVASYVEAREAAAEHRAAYIRAWDAARKIGLDVPDRIAPGGFPDDLRDRLLVATQGRESAW